MSAAAPQQEAGGAAGALRAYLAAGRLARRAAAAERAGQPLDAWRLRKRAAVLAEAAFHSLPPACSPAMRGRVAHCAAVYGYATGDWLFAETVVRRLLLHPDLPQERRGQLQQLLCDHATI